MSKTVKKIWNFITTVIVILTVATAILLVGARLVGLKVFSVLSGSMEPTYHVGALIYVKSVDCDELKVGDPISFMLDEDTVATHRIVEIVPDEDDPSVIRFRTKGDANEHEDMGLVHYKNVIGKPVFTIPGLGYVTDFIQHPPGIYYAIAFMAVLLLLCFLPDMLDDDKKKAADSGCAGNTGSSPADMGDTEQERRAAHKYNGNAPPASNKRSAGKHVK